jgi:hypothetical protein
MKTYTVLFAEDVPHYGTATIRAKNDANALKRAKAYPLSDVTSDAEWENSACKRIVWIEDADGNTIAEDIALDNCFLRYGGVAEERLCDSARATKEILKEFADVVEAYLVHGDVNLREWIARARLQAAVAEDDNDEQDFQRAQIANAEGQS